MFVKQVVLLCFLKFPVLLCLGNSTSVTFYTMASEIIDEYGDRTSMFYSGATVKVTCHTDRAGEIELVVNNDFVIATAVASASGNVSLNFTLNKTTQFGGYACRNKDTKEISLESISFGYYLCPDSVANAICKSAGDECFAPFSFCIVVQSKDDEMCSALQYGLSGSFNIRGPRKICAESSSAVVMHNSLRDAFANLSLPLFSTGLENDKCTSIPTMIYFVNKTGVVPMATVISSQILPKLSIACVPHSGTLPNEIYCVEKLKGGEVIRSWHSIACNVSNVFEGAQIRAVSAVTKLSCTALVSRSQNVSTHLFVVHLDQKPFFRRLTTCSPPAKQHILRCGFSEENHIVGYSADVQMTLQDSVPQVVQKQQGVDNAFDFLIAMPGVYNCLGSITFTSCSMQNVISYGSFEPPLLTIDKACFGDANIHEGDAQSFPTWAVHLLIGLVIIMVAVCLMTGVVMLLRHASKKRKMSYLLGDAATETATIETKKTPKSPSTPSSSVSKTYSTGNVHYSVKKSPVSKGSNKASQKVSVAR